jgi:hypothetical protein
MEIGDGHGNGAGALLKAIKKDIKILPDFVNGVKIGE